jgi:hypothetical protein
MAEEQGQRRGSVSPVVAEVVSEAIERAGKALALARKIEPLIGRTYADRTVSAWGRGDVMPPADAVFAAAQVTGVSLDEKLGIGREPTALERQLADLQEQFDRQQRVTLAMERRLEDLATRLGEPAVSPVTQTAGRMSDLSVAEAVLIQLEADLSHLGRQLGRQWDDHVGSAESDMSATKRVMRRIGRLEARAAELGIPPPQGGYVVEPASDDDATVQAWVTDLLPILQRQISLVEDRVRRLASSPDAASEAG